MWNTLYGEHLIWGTPYMGTPYMGNTLYGEHLIWGTPYMGNTLYGEHLVLSHFDTLLYKGMLVIHKDIRLL